MDAAGLMVAEPVMVPGNGVLELRFNSVRVRGASSAGCAIQSNSPVSLMDCTAPSADGRGLRERLAGRPRRACVCAGPNQPVLLPGLANDGARLMYRGAGRRRPAIYSDCHGTVGAVLAMWTPRPVLPPQLLPRAVSGKIAGPGNRRLRDYRCRPLRRDPPGAASATGQGGEAIMNVALCRESGRFAELPARRESRRGGH